VRLAILILLAGSLSAWADNSSILVKTELLVNGKSIGKPQMRVLAGESAEIQIGARSKEPLRMKVLAKPIDGKLNEIFLDMDFEYYSGERQIRSTPKVIARAGDEAIMTLEESTKGEKIQLRVMATPVVR
jgi:hypothetical protein